MILLNAQLPDPREAGMKAYNLSLLISNTFNVPAAVVLPKDYFACDEAELNRRLTELTQQLMQLLPSADGWAVRSSAADEDGITGAQAGKYRTRRIAHPDELPDAAVEVHEGGVPVILQRFIEPDYAGILFTCNPLTGEENLHIELVQGRGEQLAGGCLNPLYTYSNGSWSKPTDVPEKLLHQLKSDAATAAVLFKHHVDMEFCIKDGVLYWLQVRPVTAIPDSCDDSAGLDEGWFLLDQCTEPVTPLVRELDPGGFFQMPYWDTRFVRHYPYVRLKQAPAADTAALSSPDWQTLRSRFEPEFDRQLQEDLTVYTLQELWELAAERIKQNRAYVAAYLDRGWLKERRVTGEKLKEIISRYIGDNADVQLVLSSLTEGLNTLTYQKNAELHQLICAAGSYPDFNELSAAVLTGAPHPWGEKFNAFIHKYGYELPHPLALHLNTLAESAGDLLARIRAESVKLNGREKVQRPLSRESAAAELEQQMDTAEKSAFRQLLQAYRLYILRTEDDDYLLQKGAAAVRKALVEMERRFVANGALKEAGSIFFLNAAEIASMLSGAASGTLQSDIAIRREAFEAARQIRPELNFASAKAEEAEAGNCLRGVGVSRGLIQGKVYKVRNPLDREAYQHIPHDAIIVAPVLTPNLTYSIISCAAIVTEVGGFLSHGAIFARETGIPAIVQAAGALDWLNTGDEVIVDADQGVIHKLNK